MKNFKLLLEHPAFAMLSLAASMLLLLQSCDCMEGVEDQNDTMIEEPSSALTPSYVAQLLSDLPLDLDNVREVHDAVTASLNNGYDEEYTFRSLLSTPGMGVGDEVFRTRSVKEYVRPLADMFGAELGGRASTRAAGGTDELKESGLQIYWPYSEEWDGVSFPAITFNPEDGSESNEGYLREPLPDGSFKIAKVIVDEEYAMKHPVWIVNRNEDSGYLTPRLLEAMSGDQQVATRADTEMRTVRIKEFKAHRNYDSFFAGGSEFVIKCGALNAFTANILSDMSNYSPNIVDMMITVKRKQVGQFLRFNTIIVPDWSPQLVESAFLMVEDDGGKRTSWKCDGTVKIKSKSYGFEVEIPLNRNDDIVWRGKLSLAYLEKYNGKPNRLGDVSVTFTID